LETWRNQNLQTCTKGFADYGYNTKSVFLMKKQYVLCRFEGAQETPVIDVAIRKSSQNHFSKGVFVLRNTVPEVLDA